jgi:hypothetical protein
LACLSVQHDCINIGWIETVLNDGVDHCLIKKFTRKHVSIQVPRLFAEMKHKGRGMYGLDKGVTGKMTFPKAFYEWITKRLHVYRLYQFFVEVINGLVVADRDATTHVRVNDSVLAPW